jgi:hypothetical protein
MKKQSLPVGNSNFIDIRRRNSYYVDKSMLIKEFIETDSMVTLITRPRRFGKTLNMTMLREFFDITKDSGSLFEGLAIMETEYASYINTRPVIFLTFKNCRGGNPDSLRLMLIGALEGEYRKYNGIIGRSGTEESELLGDRYQKLSDRTPTFDELRTYISDLLEYVYTYYNIPPLLLIDEYEQPLLSSYEHVFREEMTDFFSVFLGAALKDNENLGNALLTGIQRVIKESIFSQINNIDVYTVLDERYSGYFGLTESETERLLTNYGLTLNQRVKEKYDGYVFGGMEIYNPWSIISYASKKQLSNYWVNTSTNALVRESLRLAGQDFTRDFERLIKFGEVEIAAKLDTSFIELKSTVTLWGLLINAGYLTAVTHDPESITMVARIPNGEVREELASIVAEMSSVPDGKLQLMLKWLTDAKIDKFAEIYQDIVLSYTSYYDAKENAYHMLFLGMCVSLAGLYKITSNLETGHGRSDIRLESRYETRPHLIIEFKQGEDLDRLKKEALEQITDRKYYHGLKGEVVCVGVAHDKKRCAVEWKVIEA